MLLAIVLSAIVLIGWQIFFGLPNMQQQQQQKQQQTQTQPVTPPGTPAPTGQPAPTTTQPAPGQAVPVPGVLPGQTLTREAALKASPRLGIETPRVTGSINLKGGRIDDLLLTTYRETVSPKSPPVVLLAPSGSPLPFYAEFGWVADRRQHHAAAEQRDRLEATGRGHARRRPSRHARSRQRPGPGIPPHDLGRRQVHVHGARRRREQGLRARHALSLRADLTSRAPEARGLLHPARGPDRRVRRAGPERGRLRRDREAEADVVQGHQCVARHHRQILGGDAAAGQRRRDPGGVLERPRRHHQDLPDPLPARLDHDPARRDRRRQCAAVRRRQGGRDRRRLRPPVQAQSLRAVDRLGLLPLHHQAAVPGDGLDLTATSATSASPSC